MNGKKNKLNSKIILIFNSNPNAHYMQKKKKKSLFFKQHASCYSS